MQKLVTFLFLAAFALNLHAAEAKWLTDFDAVKKQAAKENKAILMDFTGSDWCPPCKALKKNVFDKEEFSKFADKSAPIALVGFHVVHDNKDLGEIIEIIEMPHQLLGRIVINGKDALIPLHEETLLKVDKKKKQVHVQLPYGLLDIYG